MNRVLIVDDNPIDIKLAAAWIAECGMSSFSAADGVEALELLKTEPADIVLTDMNMPNMDGLELVAELKDKMPSLPVILMTAKGSEKIAVKALNAGAASYVPKQDLRNELKSAIEMVMAASNAERQQQQVFKHMTYSEFRFCFGNDHSITETLVGYFQDALRQHRICEEGELLRVGTALSEALTNAIDHGNLELSSELRDDDDRAYRLEGQRRMKLDPYKDRKVNVTTRISDSTAMFSVRDEGPGFDPSILPDPTDPENLMRPHGRGLMLIRMFMDEVTFNETGNEICLYKHAANKEE